MTAICHSDLYLELILSVSQGRKTDHLINVIIELQDYYTNEQKN